MATQEEIVNLLGANPGSLGPVHDKDIRIFADNSLAPTTKLFKSLT
jgi:prolyl-tRNA synthetase